jgi:hypothetical protein
MLPPFLSRRDMLARCANGFGAVALSALLAEQEAHSAAAPARTEDGLHHKPTARNIIFLYMDGGVSQVDSFDPKPLLTKHHGEAPGKFFKVEPTQFDNIGKVLASPWKFAQHGESGHWISTLFPHISKCADSLAVIRSMTSRFPEHTSANYFLHTGSGLQGRPSMGAWLSYGLGSLNKNLPGFVVLNGGLIPPGGLDNFNSGFLPAAHQGSVFKSGAHPVANIRRLERDEATQKRKLDLVRRLDQLNPQRNDALEAAIANQETAFRMQTAVPELMDIAGETKATQQLYGLEAEYAPTRSYGRQCLIARRLVERGVRFIELTCPGVGHDRWDQHSNLKKGHEDNARAVDQPIGALLIDLKKRGLLDSTLVVWTGEFGRTPFAQGSDGRDHNPFGFSLWMAGGGIKGGTVYGATDEWGYKAIQDKLEIHDLHATMLHTLGIDHKKLTVRFGGRDMRLTDVHGEVIKPVLA